MVVPLAAIMEPEDGLGGIGGLAQRGRSPKDSIFAAIGRWSYGCGWADCLLHGTTYESGETAHGGFSRLYANAGGAGTC